MALTKQQFIELRGKGLSVEQIVKFESEEKPKSTTTSLGYGDRLGQTYLGAAQDIQKGIIEGAEGIRKGTEMARQGNLIGGLKQTIGSEVRTGLRAAGGLAGAVFTPITEAPGIKQGIEAVGKGITNIPGVKDVVLKLNNLAQKYPNAAKDIQNIVDIAVVGSSGKVTNAVGGVAKKPALGLAEKGFQGIEKTGSALKNLGEKSYGISVPLQESTKIAVQNYNKVHPTLAGRVFGMFSNATYAKDGITKAVKPITEAQTAARYGLTGTEKIIGEQAGNVSDKIWKGIVKPKLSGVKERVDMKKFFSNIEKEITKTTPEISRRKALQEALNSLKDDFGKVSKVSLDKLQQYKEGWAKFLPDRVYKGKPIAGAFKEVQNLASQRARNIIYKYVGEEGKQAYLDYGNLKSIAEFGLKVQDPLRTKGITKQAWELILDTGITPVATFGGNMLYRTGSGLEFIGQKGAKTVRDIITKGTINPQKDTIEQIIEKSGGWKPGTRVKFDTALINKDVKTIKALLPEVPKEYVKRFSKEISDVLKNQY